MYTVSWVVKASKLCDLRCRYCYEWDELGDPSRISLSSWRKLLVAMRSYHRLTSQRLGIPVETRIIWHGGEPLLLPTSYVSAVLEAEQELFGAGDEGPEGGRLVNAIQTNLHSLSDEKIHLLKAGAFQVGVSMDFVGGVRLSLPGRETEERVAENMDRLRSAGVPLGAIVVLARHTRPHLRKIYDFYEQLGISFRVLPLFPSPLNTPDAAFALTTAEMIAGLNDLFVYWLDRGCEVDVDPLREYLKAALLKMTGLSKEPWGRRTHGDAVLLVNTDGEVYQVTDAYEKEKSLGNVFARPMDEIVGSAAYADSLDRSDALVAAHCAACELRGPCNTAPVFESRLANPPGSRCAIAYPVQDFITRYLAEAGFDEKELNAMLPEAVEARFAI